jgi:hypothetical protein
MQYGVVATDPSLDGVSRASRPMEVERAPPAQILDLLVEDDRLNVYAGELEVRPPGAPTTGAPDGRAGAAEAQFDTL